MNDVMKTLRKCGCRVGTDAELVAVNADGDIDFAAGLFLMQPRRESDRAGINECVAYYILSEPLTITAESDESEAVL